MASLDDYFKKRTEGMQNSQQTAAPLDAKPDPAASYIDRISQTLSGNDSVVKNARQEAGTKNAVSDYLANRQAKQENVNAGYSPGTLQSQRTQDRYQAVSNESALARDAGVNDLARQRTDTAMSQANQLRQEDRGDIQTLINSVEDPVYKAYLFKIWGAGGDVRQELARGLNVNGQQPSNTVNPVNGEGIGESTTPATGSGSGTSGFVDEFGRPRQGTPAELAAQAAHDWVKNLYPDVDPSSTEFKALVQSRLGGADEAEMRTITKANKDAKLEDAKTAAASNFSNLTPEQTKILTENTQEFNPLQIPVGVGLFDAFKQTNPIVKISGKLYKPVDTIQWKQGKNRDFSVFQGPDDTYLYVDKSGKTTTTPIHQGTDTAARTRWLETFK